MICQSIGTSHQYLAKPCDIEQLKATIQRACALRDVLKSDSLRDLVAGMRTIPSMPALYMAIKKEAESTRSSLKVIEQIISKDMGMTAKLLQLANSAYFGLGRNVSTVGDAVGLIGLDTIQGLVLTIHVFAQFKHEKASRHFHVDRLWGGESGRRHIGPIHCAGGATSCARD